MTDQEPPTSPPCKNTPPKTTRIPRKNEIKPNPLQYKIQRPPGSNSVVDAFRKYNQVVSIMIQGGMIELIGVWDENGTDDGFDPFLKNSVRERTEFAIRSGLMKLADRRGPPGSLYEYLPSPQKKRKRNGDPFPRHWYLRLVREEPENEDNVELRRRIVQSVVHYLTKLEVKGRMERVKNKRNNKESSGKYHRQDNQQTLENFYLIPDYWDLTPAERMPLDHYVVDEDVAFAIYETFALEGSNAYATFAVQYPDCAKYFFSGPPYCQIAISEFGYPDTTKQMGFDPNPDQTVQPDVPQDKSSHQEAVDDYFGDLSE